MFKPHRLGINVFGKLPKTVERFLEKNPEVLSKLAEIEVSRDAEGTHYWGYAKDGFWFPSMQCGTAHEMRIRDFIDVLKTVEPRRW